MLAHRSGECWKEDTQALCSLRLCALVELEVYCQQLRKYVFRLPRSFFTCRHRWQLQRRSVCCGDSTDGVKLAGASQYEG